MPKDGQFKNLIESIKGNPCVTTLISNRIGTCPDLKNWRVGRITDCDLKNAMPLPSNQAYPTMN